MTPKQLIKHYGTTTSAAQAVGLYKQLVHGWLKSGAIPLDKQCLYEVESGGALKADIPPEMRNSAAEPAQAA